MNFLVLRGETKLHIYIFINYIYGKQVSFGSVFGVGTQ